MVTIIVQISKILMLLFMALFVLDSFLGIKEKDTLKKGFYIKRQRAVMFIVHFLGNIAILAVKQELLYFLFYALEIVILCIFILIFNNLYVRSSKFIVNNLCMFTIIGFIILVRLNFNMALKQLVFFAVAVAIAALIPWIIKKVTSLPNYAWLYCGLGILLLSVVLAIATVSHGAKLAITLGPIRIQPSEFVKISYVFFLASMLQKKKSFRNVVLISILAATHVLILVASRDLGAALLFFVTYMFMIYVATKDLRYLITIAFGGAISAVAAYYLFSHVRIRVLAWKDPFAVIDGAGYQVSQSLFAIGTGGWFGTGLYQGLPHSIPVVEKDFIFSAISEELGLIFALLLVLLSMNCLLLFFDIAMKIKNQFYRLVILGFSVLYGAQVFLTVGGATKFIPSTGVTYPLVSYGGSSLFSTVIMFSVIQGIYILKENEGEQIAKKRKTNQNIKTCKKNKS